MALRYAASSRSHSAQLSFLSGGVVFSPDGNNSKTPLFCFGSSIAGHLSRSPLERKYKKRNKHGLFRFWNKITVVNRCNLRCEKFLREGISKREVVPCKKVPSQEM